MRIEISTYEIESFLQNNAVANQKIGSYERALEAPYYLQCLCPPDEGLLSPGRTGSLLWNSSWIYLGVCAAPTGGV